MMIKKWTGGFLLALCLGAILLAPSSAFAQRRTGGRWRGDGWQNRTYWGGNYRGNEWGRDSWGWGVGVGVPYFGWTGYRPWHYDNYYAPSYYSEPTTVYSGNDVTYSSSAYSPQANDRARIGIRIPGEHADIWIEGEHSVQNKPTEFYVSPPLTTGKKYYYEVRARWTGANGQTMDQTRSFAVYAGNPVGVDFTQPAPADQKVISTSDRKQSPPLDGRPIPRPERPTAPSPDR